MIFVQNPPDGLTYPTPEQVAQWPPPNYINPTSRRGLLIGIETSITLITAGVLAARFYAKTLVKRGLGWDDWIMLLAMIFSVVIAILHCLTTRHATGLHAWDIQLDNLPTPTLLTYISAILNPIAVSLVKISICITQLRVLQTQADRIFAKCAIAFVSCYCVAISLTTALQCSPPRAYFDYHFVAPNYTCVDTASFNISAQALNSLTDFVIFLWPIRTIWTVRVPIKQRLGLIFVFSLGIIVCVAGVARMVYLHQYFHNYDLWWIVALVMICLSIEMNLGIICGSLPAIKPLLNRLFPNTFGSNAGRSNRSGSSFGNKLPFAKLTIGSQTLPASSTAFSGVSVPVKFDDRWDSSESDRSESPIWVREPPRTLRYENNWSPSATTYADSQLSKPNPQTSFFLTETRIDPQDLDDASYELNKPVNRLPGYAV